MQRLDGDGLAFLHAGGTIIKKKLTYGEKLRIDTGCLVAITEGIDFNIQFASDVKSAVFGGEGIFFVPVIGWFIILPLGGIVSFVLCIMGVINAINEKSKELPVIGKYRLIK